MVALNDYKNDYIAICKPWLKSFKNKSRCAQFLFTNFLKDYLKISHTKVETSIHFLPFCGLKNYKRQIE